MSTKANQIANSGREEWPSPGSLLGSSDEIDYTQFCTDWYMPEPGVTAESSESEAPELKPRDRKLSPARLAFRSTGSSEGPLGTPGIAERTESVYGSLK